MFRHGVQLIRIILEVDDGEWFRRECAYSVTIGDFMTTRYAQVEIENLLKVDSRFIEFSMNEAWISPAFPESKEFDEEDLQRFRLIAELRDRLGVNESGIDVILHLLDQLYVLRSRLVNEPV